MSRTLLADVHAAGIPATATATAGAQPIVAQLKTADLALNPSGLGNIVADAVMFLVTGILNAGTLLSAQFVWTHGAQSQTFPVILSGTEGSDYFTLSPDLLGWSAAVFDATTVRLEADVSLGAHQSATLTLQDVEAKAFAQTTRFNFGATAGLSSEGTADPGPQGSATGLVAGGEAGVPSRGSVAGIDAEGLA